MIFRRGRSGWGRLQGRRNRTHKEFHGKYNACVGANYHRKSCFSLLKLQQVLRFLWVYTDAVIKNKQNFKGKHPFAENRNFVRSLMDAWFILYSKADPDNFVDAVDGAHEVFVPDTINTAEE